MKKQIVLFIVALAFVLTIPGATSAANTNTTQIGQQVTEQALADTTLNMDQADKNMVITTASTAQLNEQTTEDSIQAVVDKTSTLSDGQAITYGSGNLLIINDPQGPLWFTFISLTGDTLMAKTFTISQNGTINASKTVNIGTTQTSTNFQESITTLGSNGYNIAAIANLWAAGAPADLLATTYTAGTITSGAMSNYAMIKQFTQNYSSGTNYLFINPGNLNDDSYLFDSLGMTKSYAMSGGDPDKLGILQYNSTSKTGVLLVMQMNSLTSNFTAQTGTGVVESALSGIQYNLWLFNQLKTNPSSLYTILVKKTVNEAAYNYLWYDSTLGYGHGLDEAYIAGLPDITTTYDQSKSVIPVIDVQGMKELGIEIFDQAQTALGYTTAEAFTADIKAGKVGVLVAPYYVNFNGKSIVGLLDGINNSGALTIHTLMTNWHPWNHSQGSFKVLFFRVDNVDLNNAANTQFTKVLVTATPKDDGYTLTTGAGTGPGYITILPIAYAQNLSYDLVRSVRAGCMKTEQMWDASLYGMKKYPLGINDQYMVIDLSPDTRTYMFRTALLGVSPGQGTYFTLGQTSSQNAVYVLIKWNSVTNTGTAALIEYNADIAANMMKADGYTVTDQWNLYWHLDKVFKDSSYLDAVFSVVSEIPLTPDSLAALTGEGGEPVSYMSNYTSPTASTDINSGTYNADQIITLTASPGTTIYYTLDGTTPTLTSTLYTIPIAITKTSTLQYIAVDQNGYISPVYTQNYTIEKPTTPTNPTNPTNPDQNYPGTPATVSAATETTPATPTETAPAAATPTSTNTPTSTSSNIPIGSIIGAIILAIAAILIYLARDTITATIKGTGKPGK